MPDTNNKFEDLKELIEKINTLLPQNEQMSLQPKKTINAKNLFVCVYQDDFNSGIEIFEKKEHRSTSYSVIHCGKKYNNAFDQGFVYKSMSSDKIAILFTHLKLNNTILWAKIGEKLLLEHRYNNASIIANCYPLDIMSFNTIRTNMFNNGIISSFDIDYTTEEEITKVLAYLQDNFLEKKDCFSRKAKKKK